MRGARAVLPFRHAHLSLDPARTERVLRQIEDGIRWRMRLYRLRRLGRGVERVMASGLLLAWVALIVLLLLRFARAMGVIA